MSPWFRPALDFQKYLRGVRRVHQEEKQSLHCFDRVVAGESAADEMDLVEHVVGNLQFFPAWIR